MTGTGTLGLLHTSPVHVPVFDGLRDRHHPGLGLRHRVDEDLLARARADGPDAVAGEVAAALSALVADGADAVVCTCSTIGGVAERQAAAAGVPVLRVDRPMAAEAARHRRIVVVAALRSTLDPTVALIAEESGPEPSLIGTVVVDGAWELFEAGDRDGYLDAVAAAVDGAPPSDGVVVLAQASMADAVDRTTTSRPVLASPRLGLAAAARAVAARHTAEAVGRAED
ncbi:aspartate/glutamate racemase family protein [Streptomyces sp. NPDC018038]|uniref:aspartate/glutamate racemase family protein n=1 Tax=Streptomyces sp. NPDC018038 TaxID=3365036 RepID=UPI00379F4109